ncbi:MAG TPA: PEGA domain-containing protein [Steroidobacteraceae bacterium]|nr:PEGA domain-containing protein [Steroidobacteraceae bacterium]
MEPSRSLDASIILRTESGDTRYGGRVVFDAGTGTMRSDVDSPEPDAAPQTTLRSANGRWLIDATPESRVSINGVPLGGARVVNAGDVVTVSGSQLLVEEAAPSSLSLRRFELVGNDTLPPVGDSVRTLAPPAEDLAIDLGEVPTIEGFVAPRVRSATRSSWNYAAWVMAALLALVLGMFALLEPIALDLKPGDAHVESQGAFSWQSASSVFVFPGEHRLHAERVGYIPADVSVQVGGPQPARALIHLVKLPGQLEVDTGGVAAEISADGAPLGRVPGVVAVPAGERTLTFRAARHLDLSQRITIAGGGEKQKLEVKLKPNFALVSISSVPAGAAIEVDGKPAGSTPAKLELDAGIRRVQVVSPGLRIWNSSVVVNAGVPQNIGPITLGAADARVTVRSVPSGAQVTAGGTFRGLTPITIELSPGISHAISVARAGYAPWTREVLAEAGKESALDARLAALLVNVRVQGEPADAEVFINGNAQGKAPVSVQLPASRHRIEVRKEGYSPYVADVALAPGIGRTLDFKLIDPKDVAGNAPQKVTTKIGVKLLVVAGGTFQAGTDRREQGRRPNEGSHKVTLFRPFYMGEREITNGQFRQFRTEHNSGSFGENSLDLDKQPVVRVTWEEAADFCNWLSAQEGLPPAYKPLEGGGFELITPVSTGYRLPTEAEWEFVARAASTGKPLKYPWGKDLPVVSGSANVAGSEAFGVLGVSLDGHKDEFPVTSAPALFPPNPLGFFDMAGNAAEWTNDKYLSFVPSTPVTDPLGPNDSKGHTYRGSSWRTAASSELRFPWREGAIEATDFIGFRVARYVAPPDPETTEIPVAPGPAPANEPASAAPASAPAKESAPANEPVAKQ